MYCDGRCLGFLFSLNSRPPAVQRKTARLDENRLEEEDDEQDGAGAGDGDAAVAEEEEAFCVCGKPAEFDCSRCAKQSYCSNECQRRDWKTHRERCKQLVEEARLAAEAGQQATAAVGARGPR